PAAGPFLAAARAAGVRRVVLLGSLAELPGVPGAAELGRAVRSFPEWAVLRPSWFMQNFTGTHVHAAGIREEGVIRTATGDGRIGFVDAEDIAAVAARALTDAHAPDTDLVLTGPEALSHDDIAAAVTGVTGRPVEHRRLTREQMRDLLSAQMPPAFAALLADMDHAISEGAEDRVTDTVLHVTGRPPGSFRALLEREAERRG
ncbi:NmrA family NAD(P)-binding protein, partial [Nocardiopsis tropica]|nr:NmrA family NAD(P)-binding protein [Nocardiopsis tropica]